MKVLQIIKKLIPSILAVAVAGLLIYTYSLVSINTKLSNTNDSLLIKNAYIEYQKDSIDHAYLILSKENKQKDSTLVVVEKQYKKYKQENIQLQSKLTQLENDMVNISPDSSYIYLMHRYIPSQNILQYRFAPNQVKSIHYDLLKGDIIAQSNINLSNTLILSETMYSLRTQMYNNCNSQNSLLQYKVKLTENQNSNLNKLINNKDKQIKLLKFGMYGITGVLTTALTFVTIKALIK